MEVSKERNEGKKDEMKELGFDSETRCYRGVNTYTCMVCPGSSVKEPYSLKIARGLARMALSTHVNAITAKHTSLRILVSRWYTIHLKCKTLDTKWM